MCSFFADVLFITVKSKGSIIKVGVAASEVEMALALHLVRCLTSWHALQAFLLLVGATSSGERLPAFTTDAFYTCCM